MVRRPAFAGGRIRADAVRSGTARSSVIEAAVTGRTSAQLYGWIYTRGARVLDLGGCPGARQCLHRGTGIYPSDGGGIRIEDMVAIEAEGPVCSPAPLKNPG